MSTDGAKSRIFFSVVAPVRLSSATHLRRERKPRVQSRAPEVFSLREIRGLAEREENTQIGLRPHHYLFVCLFIYLLLGYSYMLI